MIKISCFISLLMCLVCHIAIAQTNSNAKVVTHERATWPNIYNESADGATQIANAVTIAKKEHKHILLQFGANWCIWCHRLHNLFDSNQPVIEELTNNYVVVMIDVNRGHNGNIDEKYGHPVKLGLPVLVVLDADGKYLTTQDSSKLEQGDHHSPQKVLAFLKKWEPPA